MPAFTVGIALLCFTMISYTTHHFYPTLYLRLIEDVAAFARWLREVFLPTVRYTALPWTRRAIAAPLLRQHQTDAARPSWAVSLRAFSAR